MVEMKEGPVPIGVVFLPRPLRQSLHRLRCDYDADINDLLSAALPLVGGNNLSELARLLTESVAAPEEHALPHTYSLSRNEYGHVSAIAQRYGVGNSVVARLALELLIYYEQTHHALPPL